MEKTPKTMLDQLIHFDQQLLLALNGSESVYWDGIWMTITTVGTWILFFFALFVVLMRSNDMRNLLLIILMLGLAILLADQGASGICKPLFHRFRPTHEPALMGLVDVVDDYRGGFYGFMSSHAANGFAICTFLSLVIRHYLATTTLISYAVLSSYSRIYLGVHYPGDILCGALWGILCAFLVYRLYVYLRSRLHSSRQFLSSAYTRSGVLIDDVHLIPAAFSVTLLYVFFRALFYSLNH